MGYILTANAVELDKVSDAVGSKDMRLIDALVEEFGDEFGQFDEMAADRCDEDDGQEALTMQGALTQMVMGEQYHEGLGFMYAYALEFLCRHFGRGLPNGEWSAMPSGSQWAETVDRGLHAADVPEGVLRVSYHLMNRGAPIPIPEPDDFPGIGYLKLKEIRIARQALGEARLASIKDKEVLTSVQELQGWLQACADSGRDLACFYA
jgi:hypothetical protein